MKGKRINSRDKGYRTEHELVKRLQGHGINAKRVPLSGGAPGFEGDIILSLDDKELVCEVKARGEGFRQIYRWLGKKDILFIKADRKKYLAVIPLEIFLKILSKPNGGEK